MQSKLAGRTDIDDRIWIIFLNLRVNARKASVIIEVGQNDNENWFI